MPLNIGKNIIFLGYKNIKIYVPKLNEVVDAMDGEGIWYEGY